MNENICHAIKEKIILQIFYDDGYRLVEPYCYGISTAGNEVLRGFQIGGYSRSHIPIDWKLFNITKAREVVSTKVNFESIRHGYNPKDKAMVEIFCRI